MTDHDKRLVAALKYQYAILADETAKIRAENELLRHKLSMCYADGFKVVDRHRKSVGALRINDAIGGDFMSPIIAYTEHGDIVICDAVTVLQVGCEYQIEPKY